METLPSRTAQHWLMMVCLGLCTLLAACAHRPEGPSPSGLLHDEFFADAKPPAERDQVFAMSEAMRRYAHAL